MLEEQDAVKVWPLFFSVRKSVWWGNCLGVGKWYWAGAASPQLHKINKCNVYSKSFLRWDFSNTCIVYKYLYKNALLVYVIKNEHADRVQ